MPRVPGAKDVILQPFWDSSSVTSTSTTVTLFQTPKGQGTTVWGSSGSKTLEDTNMSLAGQFGSGWQFTAYTIQFQPGPATSVADLQVLLAGGSLEFVVGAKTYLELPLIYAGAGCGIYGAAASTASGVTYQSWGNGVPEPKNVFGLGELPISIMENENFSVKLTWGTLSTLSATVKFRVFLNGQLSRGVQ